MLFDITKHIKKPITGIIQIGAHHGNDYDILKNICNNILMFEPQKSAFNILKNKLGNKENLVIENFAIGSKKDKLVMHTEQANLGQSSSLLVPFLHKLQYPYITFTGTETVDVITLNEYFENKKFNYNLMTIDVQGYELEVLKGSTNLLSNIEYILCEVNRAELYVGCPMVDEIDIFLKNYSFKREITSWVGHTWGDALYMKE